MGKHIKVLLYINAILGLSSIIFFITDLELIEINAGGIFLRGFLSIVQIIIFGVTIFYLCHYLKTVDKERDNVSDKYNELDKIKGLLVNVTPTGIVFIKKEGIIEYVNPAAGKILGSVKTVGLNIFEFDTVKQSKLYNGIRNASKGIYTEILGEHYTSFTSRNKKVLNFYITPVINENTESVITIILFIHDITQENSLKDEIEETYISTIEAFAELVDARDKYTGEHSKNVSKYVSMICNELNLDEKMKEEIRVAANIHDLGKIGISDRILNKPEKLTNEEYDCIKQHPVLGAKIISRIIGFNNISLIIRHHHEKWDGTGYLSGLKDIEIPLGSQIIAIADAYDAMTSDRVYRKNLGEEKAMQILLEEKGKQFNPRLVDIFIEKIRLDKYT